jgi:hypothetical protein
VTARAPRPGAQLRDLPSGVLAVLVAVVAVLALALRVLTVAVSVGADLVDRVAAAAEAADQALTARYGVAPLAAPLPVLVERGAR